ncbi:TetR/AcrR family transcriptional regulator [Pendulispora albinea]|uniref:TetR/AcrR family transcriptional regulator n=1 Tax=Pendulispora albinea TaxID=2741071 RepID=A0ABZ2LVN5_9BACT
MPTDNVEERDAKRRRAILEAARHCFLHFGYAKTSLDDIAKRANISRPLIYRKFKNKDDIYVAVFEFTMAGRYPAVERVLAGRGSKRDKLYRIYEILLLEPWSETSGAPMADEYYDVCERLFPEVDAKYQRFLLKHTQAILGSKEHSQVFMLAVEGLHSDSPTLPVLRRRLHLLVERFVA